MVFDELDYGVTKRVDLHGLNREEAMAELCNAIYHLDSNYSGLMVVHGYHSGKVLRKLVREEFVHPRIEKRVSVDASITFLKIKKD